MEQSAQPLFHRGWSPSGNVPELHPKHPTASSPPAKEGPTIRNSPFEGGKGDVINLHTHSNNYLSELGFLRWLGLVGFPRQTPPHRQAPRLPRRGRLNKARSLCSIGGGRCTALYHSPA